MSARKYSEDDAYAIVLDFQKFYSVDKRMPPEGETVTVMYYSVLDGAPCTQRGVWSGGSWDTENMSYTSGHMLAEVIGWAFLPGEENAL